MTQQAPPDSIVLWAFRCVSGETTPNVRLVALRYREPNALFRFYLQDPPSETDRENAEVIATNFDSSLTRLESLDIEFVVTSEPLGVLDTLDAQVYRRWEPVDQD